MFKRIAEVSDEIGSKSDVINRGYKFGEESGEFMKEVGIAIGAIRRKPSEDGVIGEGADVVITCLDIVHRIHPDLTQEQFMKVVEKKLAKWKRVAADVDADKV